MINWSVIRQEYEQGASLRSLAAKHDVGKSTIAERKLKEQWTERRTDTGHRTPDIMPLPRPSSIPVSSDALSIARIGLHQLAQHLQTDDLLTIASHKSLADALSQYVKVLLTAPQETETREGMLIPLDGISDYTRREIRRLLLEDAEQQREAS